MNVPSLPQASSVPYITKRLKRHDLKPADLSRFAGAVAGAAWVRALPLVWEKPLHFVAFLAFAQRALCAAAIRALASALILRLPGLTGLCELVSPPSSALAIRSRASSASISWMIPSMARIILAGHEGKYVLDESGQKAVDGGAS